MKKSSMLLLAAGLSTGGAAFAQSNVTIYGIVDTSIHYLNNANAKGALPETLVGFRARTVVESGYEERESGKEHYDPKMLRRR